MVWPQAKCGLSFSSAVLRASHTCSGCCGNTAPLPADHTWCVSVFALRAATNKAEVPAAPVPALVLWGTRTTCCRGLFGWLQVGGWSDGWPLQEPWQLCMPGGGLLSSCLWRAVPLDAPCAR